MALRVEEIDGDQHARNTGRGMIASCPQCAALAAELAEARRALGWDAAPAREALLTRALGLTPSGGRLVASLYAARGRVVAYGWLLDIVSEDAAFPRKVLGVQLHRARKAIGQDAIETVPRQGLRLTPKGLEVVETALARIASRTRQEPSRPFDGTVA